MFDTRKINEEMKRSEREFDQLGKKEHELSRKKELLAQKIKQLQTFQDEYDAVETALEKVVADKRTYEANIADLRAQFEKIENELRRSAANDNHRSEDYRRRG